jgi:2'-5' RNA ligase
MTLFVIGYPELSTADDDWIEDIRRKHDPQFELIRPHFTLVFGMTDIDQHAAVDHVTGVAGWFGKVDFRISRVFVDTANSEGAAFLYLVPEVGHESLYALHERLNEGPLAGTRNHEATFVPHITVGRLDDPAEAQKQVSELNQNGIDIAGTVKSLTVARIDDVGLEEVATVPLAS